jgi:Protein of unknown function (DUF3738)
MNLESLQPLANHLWQSTVFAAFAGLLTLMLRTNRAHVRHAVWLAASCKFLIPISALIAFGGLFQLRTSHIAVPPGISVVVTKVSQPLTGRADPRASLATMEGPLLQSLLAERFGLKLRRVTRESPIYALKVAKGGTKLTPTKAGTCSIGVFYGNGRMPPPPPPGGDNCPPSHPVMGTALRKLGLKLEPTQGPEEILVIDHVERPSEN